MKKIAYTLFLLPLLILTSLLVSAQGQMPVIAYASIQASHQGNLKGDATMQGRQGQIECLGFNYSTQTPLDASSGLPNGKRQHSPIVIVKRLDAATPQLLEAAYTNEVLKNVTIEFVRIGPDGRPTPYQTIKLTNATVVKINQFGGVSSPEKLLPNNGVLEEISITFQKIEIENTEGKTSAADNWNAR